MSVKKLPECTTKDELSNRIDGDIVKSMCPEDCSVYSQCLHFNERGSLKSKLTPRGIYKGN